MQIKPNSTRLKSFCVSGEWLWRLFERMDETPEFVNLPSFGNVPADAVLVGIHQPNDTIPPRLTFTFEHPDFPEVPLGERVPTFAGEMTVNRVQLVTPQMLARLNK